ncbi:MAG: DNA-binding response regulator [Deltaproteobacteria bacterium HGW-Deltaproteobacteria-15]|jgi:DNA-binding response OmpR family regulator|nr:MAG: DNA-binding response regulator [Deltaproteobacteria bacterium HGW-Deltaproteobacteria-15]
MSRRILVIEDNADLANLLAVHLRDLSYEVEIAEDGPSALAKAQQRVYDLVLLDLMLPGLDGLEVCRRIREKPPYVPIIMLTSRSSETDRVVGLEVGADDYVTKPFSIVELMARVKAMFRRVEQLRRNADRPASARVEAGDLLIDPEKRTVTLSGAAVELTAREFDLLFYFASHPGRVFTRAQLLDAVWGYGHDGYEHTVNSHINRLRAKIEDDPAQPRYVLTVWGVGYKFAEKPSAVEDP